MPTNFQRFSPIISSLSAVDLAGGPNLSKKLRIALDGEIEVCYAPFEYINPSARVVIVGITPGKTQWLKALGEARRQLDIGADEQQVLKAAKATGAFSGALRQNLVEMLDSVGLQKVLRIDTCADLFGKSSALLQSASLLQNPVFLKGENYNGKPNMVTQPILREQLMANFGVVARTLPKAIYIPLGDTVAEAIKFMVEKGYLSADQVLEGLPHPSGANGERIAYFVGRKRKADLSAKTSAEKIDIAREKLIEQLKHLI